MEIKGINKDKIQEELDSILKLSIEEQDSLYEDIEDMLLEVVFENDDLKGLLSLKEDKVTYIDHGKGYHTSSATIKLDRIGLYIKFDYNDWQEDASIKSDLQQVFAYPKRVIVYAK